MSISTSTSTPPHRVVVVGAGSIGERHVRCFLASGRCDVAFVEPAAELRAAVAARYPDARAFASLDDLRPRDFDAAVIATPTPLHVPQATHFAAAGVPVLIEKPLSVGFSRVDLLRETIEKSSVVVAVAYVYRAHAALAAMRAAVRGGRFGRPLQIVAVAGQHFPTYRPAYCATYYASHASGGGAIQDALTHVIDAGQWLVGPINELVADAAHQSLAGVDVEDVAHVLARHGDVLASYALNQFQAPNETTITVICEQGATRFELHESRWREMTEPGGEWRDHPVGPLERDALFVRQANAFLDAVTGTAAPLCDIDEGIATLHANLAILRSVETRTWQSLPRVEQLARAADADASRPREVRK